MEATRDGAELSIKTQTKLALAQYDTLARQNTFVSAAVNHVNQQATIPMHIDRTSPYEKGTRRVNKH